MDDTTTDSLRFDGQVAVITGAGGGLGLAHAQLLASRGAMVVVNDLGVSTDGTGASASYAEMAAAEICATGGLAVADTNTVSTPEGGAAIIRTALETFGRIDIVINNAGILVDKTFHNLSDEEFHRVLDVHLKGTINVTQPAWRHFREQGYGRVVSTASNAGILGNFGQANYAAAKMGIIGLTHVLAKEGAKFNIKANVIAPIARTRLTEELMGDRAALLAPELVSPVVAYLAHAEVPVSGETFSVAAGRVSRFFIGATPGYYNPHLSIEDVGRHWEQIVAEAGYRVYSGSAHEAKVLFEQLSTTTA